MTAKTYRAILSRDDCAGGPRLVQDFHQMSSGPSVAAGLCERNPGRKAGESTTGIVHNLGSTVVSLSRNARSCVTNNGHSTFVSAELTK